MEYRAAIVDVTYECKYVPSEIWNPQVQKELDGPNCVRYHNILNNVGLIGSKNELPLCLQPLYGSIQYSEVPDGMPLVDPRTLLEFLDRTAPRGVSYTSVLVQAYH